MLLSGEQRDHGEQRLSERRRAHRACHPMWLQARDDGTGYPDGEHPGVHQVGGVAFTSENVYGRDQPDEDERCRERNADGGSVSLLSFFIASSGDDGSGFPKSRAHQRRRTVR